MRNASRLAGLLLLALIIAPPSIAQIQSDDNGEESFVRQAVPILLGRRVRGALELKLLMDLDGQVGRAALLRSLMQTAEYREHWTNVIVDLLRMQRLGDRAQYPACFNNPLQPNPTVLSAIAEFVRDQSPDTTSRPPGGAFNMVDLIRSAIALDDLSPIYRAYPVALTLKFNPMIGEVSVDDAFHHTLLNRDPDCLLCHNSSASSTGNANNAADRANQALWVRTWPAPFDAESSLYGVPALLGQTVRDQSAHVFRTDQVFDPLKSAPPAGAIVPWGMDPSCGAILTNLGTLQTLDVQFANLSGPQIGLADLIRSIGAGTNALKSGGLHTLSGGAALPRAPGDQALAYLLSEKITEGVWHEVFGSNLTIANYFSRNQPQRDLLLNLADQAFNAEGWSLRALLTQILTASTGPTSGLFNRKAPDIDPNTPAYRLPLIFDPWVQKDPRLPDPMPLPQEHFNGQGEIVHRYSVQSLLHSLSASLGWPEPQRFPDTSAYPNLQLEMSLGQFLSDDYQGREGVDFQGLLGWDDRVGGCDKSGTGLAGDDWIDRLVSAVNTYNAAHPTAPLSVQDVESVLKDWLTGDGLVSANAPTPLDANHPALSEADALSALFAVPLTSSSATVTNLTAKLRRACGAIVQSGQFMLAGILPTGSSMTPALRVCNPGSPCSYPELCQDLVHLNGYLVICGATAMTIVPTPNVLCPPNVCVAFSTNQLSRCEFSPGGCSLPTSIPGLGGPGVPDCIVCGLPWSDPSLPTGIYINVPLATVTQAQGVQVYLPATGQFQPVGLDQPLRAGSVLAVRSGSVLSLKTSVGSVQTAAGGMPGKNASAWTTADKALFRALNAHSTDRLPELLARGAHPNARDLSGYTPLMLAARSNDTRAIAALMKQGADPYITSPHGFSALELALLSNARRAAVLLERISPRARALPTLRKIRPDAEVPWYFFVGRPSRKLAPPVLASLPSVEQIRKWEAEGLASGGQSGRPLTAAQAEADLDRYHATGFAADHARSPH